LLLIMVAASIPTSDDCCEFELLKETKSDAIIRDSPIVRIENLTICYWYSSRRFYEVMS
jgi:hypothetical protein